jgi:hypothetical protein
VLLAFGLALIVRYGWIMDDAFIYARYADNAALLKLGLVYNMGEYVEGFTSPMWMSWVLLWRWVGASYWTIFLGSGCLAFVAMWWALIRLDIELNAQHRQTTHARINVPLSFLALSYPVTCWFTSGMETGFIQLCAVGYALFLVDPQSRVAQVLVGLAPFVRPELAAPFVVCVLYQWWRSRRPPWLALGLGVGLNLAWLMVRIVYYAELLPNTFYAKHANDPRQGLHYLVNTFHSYYVELILAAAVVLLWWARRSGAEPERRSAARVMMWVACVPVVAYVVRIGGDAMHYRYLAFPFCLSICATSGLLETWWRAKPRRLALARSATVVSALLATLSFTLQPPQRSVHAIVAAGDPHKVHEISDPGRHRRQAYLVEVARVDPTREAQLAAGRSPETFEYAGTKTVNRDARAYVDFDQRVIHGFGLTDPFLARMVVPAQVGDRPGHRLGLGGPANRVKRINAWAEPHGVGMFQQSIDGNYGAAWVVENIDVIQIIERKAYNRHELRENLGLAFTFPGPIVVRR